MSEKTAEAHIRAAYDLARRHLYSQWKAERACELRDNAYKKYDGRGFHSVSLEAGRMYACAEFLPDIDLDFHLLKQQAREDATAEWRKETFDDFLPVVDEAA